jgi:hypothetical protein
VLLCEVGLAVSRRGSKAGAAILMAHYFPANRGCRTLFAVIRTSSSRTNFIASVVNHATVDEIDRRARAGDVSLATKANRMRAALSRGKWPQDPNAFNGFFENYCEALFLLLATDRGLALVAVPEAERPTADFATVGVPEERFELKTIDFTVETSPIAR